jgi:type IV pilus assembly protein PilO
MMAALDLKNQTTIRIVLCGVLAVAALALFFFTHFVPFGYPNRADQVQALKADYEKKSTELARARASVADLPRFEAEYEQLHGRWSMAAELLPTDRQSAGLLRKITLAGQQTGVQFVMFKPSPPRSQTYYTEMPVDVVVLGGYHEVGSFLAELANMPRIVTVSNLKLVTAPSNEYSQTTSAAFSASAYSLNTAPAAAPIQSPKPVENPKKGESTDAHVQS